MIRRLFGFNKLSTACNVPGGINPDFNLLSNSLSFETRAIPSDLCFLCADHGLSGKIIDISD
jgi:hypothetical protein